MVVQPQPQLVLSRFNTETKSTKKPPATCPALPSEMCQRTRLIQSERRAVTSVTFGMEGVHEHPPLSSEWIALYQHEHSFAHEPKQHLRTLKLDAHYNHVNLYVLGSSLAASPGCKEKPPIQVKARRCFELSFHLIIAKYLS